MCKKYDSSSIKILKGLDAVKKRPGMYIGNTDDGTGLHHMVFEIIDNSIDESLEGYCDKIDIKIHKDNSVSVKDNGRGIPIDINKEYNKSSAELIMTILHSGGKFDNDSYKISGGLHGVGISVVNALSSKLELIICKDNKTYKQIYINGNPEKSVIEKNTNDYTGTYIKFWPNLNIFKNKINFSYDILSKRFNELSFLNPNLKILLEDEINNKSNLFYNNGGIKSFLKYILNKKKIIHQNYIYINTIKNKIKIEIILQWVDSNNNIFYCFTNNIKQKEGGSHLSGLKSSITKTINNYIIKEINKKLKFEIIGDDTREGLISIISIKFSNPKFSSQTKDKLISSEVKSAVEIVLSEKLMEFLLENPIDSKLIINKIIQSSLLRNAAKKAKEIIKKKGQIDSNLLVGKLSDCQEKNPNFSELYLVEGDSAGGSAKQARNRKNQAVLSLKGKIINVEKSNLDKILLSKEIINLVTAIGCGIEKNDFNINKIRYFKIIIMTDADIDGSHIRTLLLTFFYRYAIDIIKNGYLYIAQPPLYKIIKNKTEIYIKNDEEFLNYKIDFIIKNINININDTYNKNDFKKLLKYFIKTKEIILSLKNKVPFSFINELIINNTFNENKYNEYDYIHEYINIIINNINNKKESKKYDFCINKINNYFNIILKKFYNGIYINFSIKNTFFIEDDYKNLIKFGKKLNIFINQYNEINKNKIDYNFIYKVINDLLYNFKKNLIIHRYKGLGEMNPDQLWETTMNPKNRNILQIKINNENNTNELFNILMGDSVELRKNFIDKNCLNVKNIDI